MKYIRNSFFVLALLIFVTSCQNTETHKQTPKQNDDSFSFAFLTDIHLQPERRAVEGFKQAIKKVNELNPDFVITGGDLVMDALGQSFGRADSLYKLYQECSKDFEMPVYNTMGNHEVFGIYDKSGIDPKHPEYGEKMFQNRIGRKDYSFDHKGWHFLIIDTVEEVEEEGRYMGKISDEQLKWIAEDLKTIDTTTPICISVHIPLISAATQIMYGSLEAHKDSWVVSNSKELLDLFEDYNLKLVLQGHLHILEEIYIYDITFITGGAVSARWWHGPYHGTEEGFLNVRIKGDEFSWEYIDYGWDVIEE